MFSSKASFKANKEFFMLFDIAGINASNKLSKSSLECQLLLKSIGEQPEDKISKPQNDDYNSSICFTHGLLQH